MLHTVACKFRSPEGTCCLSFCRGLYTLWCSFMRVAQSDQACELASAAQGLHKHKFWCMAGNSARSSAEFDQAETRCYCKPRSKQPYLCVVCRYLEANVMAANCQSPGRAPCDQESDWLQLHLHSAPDSPSLELLPTEDANEYFPLHTFLAGAFEREPGGLQGLNADRSNYNCSVLKLADAPDCAAIAPEQELTALSALATATIPAVMPSNSSGSSDKINAAKQNATQKQGFLAQTSRRTQSAPVTWQRKLEANRKAQKRFRQKQKVRPACHLAGCRNRLFDYSQFYVVSWFAAFCRVTLNTFKLNWRSHKKSCCS